MDYSFKNFQKTALTRLLGMDKYKDILIMFNDKNINPTSSKFTKKFNAFYRVRRNEEWQKTYYNYFEKNRYNKNITFEEILRYLYKNTGNIEASFASKMLSTINPNMPIWDQYVLKNLNIKVDNIDKDERVEKTILAYQEIIDDVNERLKDKEIKKSIDEFRNFFPELEFSDTKILDFMMWNNREDE